MSYIRACVSCADLASQRRRDQDRVLLDKQCALFAAVKQQPATPDSRQSEIDVRFMSIIRSSDSISISISISIRISISISISTFQK